MSKMISFQESAGTQKHKTCQFGKKTKTWSFMQVRCFNVLLWLTKRAEKSFLLKKEGKTATS